MSTIFIGGSRHVSRLPAGAKERIGRMVSGGHHIVVGDASGVDKAVQGYLLEMGYANVTVYCSGDSPRNKLGPWRIHPVGVPRSAKGFSFHSAKDREMARIADFGFMVWDGKSPGTILNVLRLSMGGKTSVLLVVPTGRVVTIRTMEQWRGFFSGCGVELRASVIERASPEEMGGLGFEFQPGLFDSRGVPAAPNRPSLGAARAALNKALAQGDCATFVRLLESMILGEESSSAQPRDEGDADRLQAIVGSQDLFTVTQALSSMGFRLAVELAAELVEPPLGKSEEIGHEET